MMLLSRQSMPPMLQPMPQTSLLKLQTLQRLLLRKLETLQTLQQQLLRL